MLKPIWTEGETVKIVDQTRLPGEYITVEINTIQEMWDAIKKLAVRGAPAIGSAGALGICIGVKNDDFDDCEGFLRSVKKASDHICTSRPTAYNLFWAAARMEKAAKNHAFTDKSSAVSFLFKEANSIIEEDLECCRSIGIHGAGILKGKHSFLTHCNAGGLATSGGYGTALAPIYILHEQGEAVEVYSDETRPLLQGARLTCFELKENGIPVTLLCDNMAGLVLSQGKVDACIVGSDRIAANGDAANKIGTFSLSILAKHFGIPFYVAAPFSTIDGSLATGKEIPIEEREAAEVFSFGGCRNAPEGIKAYNPAFDVTPHENITGIITEKGVFYPPYDFSEIK